MDQSPTAVFSGNNLLAICTIRARYEYGLSISGNISFETFDDQDWATLMKPKITVVVQTTNESGRKPAEMVMERINNYHNLIKLILLEPNLHFIESVGSPTIPKEVNLQHQNQI